jgi:hypothetical protein
VLENIPKISAMSYEAARVKAETPTLSELLSTLRQVKQRNLWLYNSIMNNVNSTMEKLTRCMHNSDETTILNIKKELIWNNLECLDLVDRVLFEKNMHGRMDLCLDNHNKTELNTWDSDKCYC